LPCSLDIRLTGDLRFSCVLCSPVDEMDRFLASLATPFTFKWTPSRLYNDISTAPFNNLFKMLRHFSFLNLAISNFINQIGKPSYGKPCTYLLITTCLNISCAFSSFEARGSYSFCWYWLYCRSLLYLFLIYLLMIH
jgi:hypothetical protein